MTEESEGKLEAQPQSVVFAELALRVGQRDAGAEVLLHRYAAQRDAEVAALEKKIADLQELSD